MKGQSFVRRLSFAVAGLRLALRRESSLRIQLLAAAAVFMTLALVHPPAIWWAIFVLAIGLVIVAELLNTALEALADRLHPEQHPGIKAAKDVAAAAVLVAAGTALIVAAIFMLRQHAQMP